MHFYQFNIGDYRKDTSHLSILEHGVYRLLLDTYYATELPLTTDIRQLSRMHCLRSADEKAALDVVLSDFFLLTESGYRHNGCDKVLAKVYEKSEKARQSAQKKWDIAKEKKSERMEKECERIKNGCERIKNACEQDALDMLPITHNPLPNTQENLTPSDDGYERDKDDPKRGEMILKSGEMFPVYDSDITKLEQTYQTIDVVYQLKMMKAWLESNPNKRKTKTGMPKFINSWLNRAVNNG